MRKATIAALVCVCFTFVPVISPSPALAGPNFQAVHDRIGEIVAGKEEVGYLRAVKELERVLATWPEETGAVPWALFWVGTICQEAGDINRAIAAFQRLLEEFPQQLEAGAWARWGLANQCYLPRGEFDKGLPLLLEMVTHSNAYEGSNVPHCGALFLPWARLHLVEYLGKAASAYVEQGRPGEFAHLIRGALIGNWSGPAWEILADTMLALGQGLAVPRNAEEEECYQTVVYDYEHFWLPGVPPPSADRDRALRWLACFQLIYGESRLAKQLCQQVLDGKSGTLEACRAGALLGRLQKTQQNVRESFTAYRAALAAFPASTPPPDALVTLLDGYGQRGEWELAIQDVGPFIDAYCASADASAVIWADVYDALCAATQDMMRRGQHVAARALLQASLGMPFSAEAREAHKKVIELSQGTSWLETRANLEESFADTYVVEGNYERAIELYQDMLPRYAGMPISARPALQIGWCRARQGRYEEAREAYQRVIKEHEGTVWAAVAQEAIDALVTGAGDAVSQPTITHEEAVNRAIEFAHAAGVFYDVEPAATFPAPAPRPNCWLLEFRGPASQLPMLEIWVEDNTGNVLQLSHSQLGHRRTGEDPVFPISELAALNRAREIFDAAGMPTDAKLYSVRLVNHAPLSPGSLEWAVRWRRSYEGYLFDRRDFAIVSLDAYGRGLLGMGVNWRSLPPPVTEVSIDESTAIERSRAYLAAKGIRVGDVVSAGLFIVQPDDYWEEHPKRLGWTAASRLAWVVHFYVPGWSAFVWVDAQDGEVLGGTQTKGIILPEGAVMQPPPTVGLTDVIAARRIGGRHMAEDPFALDNDKNPEEFAALVKALEGLEPTERTETICPTLLRVEASDGKAYFLGYDAASHYLVARAIQAEDGRLMWLDLQPAWMTTPEFDALLAKLAPPVELLDRAIEIHTELTTKGSANEVN